nr:hypothetical protein [Tanacetum cinerariifolium]
MKSLKEKVEYKLVKQDQSLQTVHMLCRPWPLYNDLNKVAIGYKNPLCLTRAKQAQPALYNGHEILKNNHAPAKVHNAEDTLEIVEITKKKMNAKMTNPECVTHKVKISPHDYTKENFLATFTPQKLLTSKQIYWFNDLMKLKSEALKERAKVFRPIKAFKVYPPNTPATLVPKRSLTGNGGLNKPKHVTSKRKHDAIDLKNLLIANDNLIAECLSKEVFFVVTKSELNVARFAEMHVANTSVEARCLALEAELATLRDKSHQENQGELNKKFSKLELKTSVSKAKVQPPVLTRTKHAIDVELIVPRLRNNRDAHLYYLRHLKESVEIIRDIVEEANVKTNVPVPPSTGVTSYPKASGSQPKSNLKTNRILPAKGANKLPVEDLPRTNKSHLRTTNCVDSSSRLKRT